MRKQLMCMLMLLGILLTLSGCRGHLDEQVTEQDPASDVSYVQVLESVEEKILYTGGDAEDSQAMLYDLNGDGVEELLLSYLYGSESVAFEVWTMSDEMPVQLCAVTDMGSLAGDGSYGMSLAEDDGHKTLCLWYQNSEASPPGSTARYSMSLWEIGESVFPYGPQRMGWSIYRTESDAELLNFYGRGNYTLEDCEALIEKWTDAPEEQLAGSNVTDGLTVQALLEQLK